VGVKYRNCKEMFSKEIP